MPTRDRPARILAAAGLLLAGGLLLGAGGGANRPDLAAFERPDAIPFPADNPYTPEKAALGERLFFDTRLSGGNSFACANCHDPARGWSDGKPRGVGERGIPVDRRTPGILDLAWGERYFWDGRAASLEAQALGPITAQFEMDQPLEELVAELSADPDTVAAFRVAFPEAKAGEPAVTVPRIAAALATYQRTLRTAVSPFDRWVAGDETAVDEAAKRGFAVFTGAAGCANCHKGWAFTDHAFHDIGLPSSDRGRGTVLPGLDHAFKTPPLRDISRRAPYMHDGSLATLEDVLHHYEGGINERPSLSEDLPLQISLSARETADLLAFLRSLDSDAPGGPAQPVKAVTVPTVKAPGGLAAEEAVVSQRDRRFAPGAVVVRTGGTLTILNDDTRRHNVRISAPGVEVNTGIQAPGQTVRIPLTEAGTFTAHCGVHPEMKLTVAVVPVSEQPKRHSAGEAKP